MVRGSGGRAAGRCHPGRVMLRAPVGQPVQPGVSAGSYTGGCCGVQGLGFGVCGCESAGVPAGSEKSVGNAIGKAKEMLALLRLPNESHFIRSGCL